MKRKSLLMVYNIIIIIGLCSVNDVQSFDGQMELSTRLKFETLARRLANIYYGKMIEDRQQLEASPRLTLDFLADPALFVSILHTLEVAYWSMPFGWLLMPIINFFRMPNKRRRQLGEKSWRKFLTLSKPLREDELHRYQSNLLKSLDIYKHFTVLM